MDFTFGSFAPFVMAELNRLRTLVNSKTSNKVRCVSASANTQSNDRFILVDTSTSSNRITLRTQDTTAGRIITIKDKTGDADSNTLAIATAGSQKIDGSTSDFLITSSYGVVNLMSDGTDWFILSIYPTIINA